LTRISIKPGVLINSTDVAFNSTVQFIEENEESFENIRFAGAVPAYEDIKTPLHGAFDRVKVPNICNYIGSSVGRNAYFSWVNSEPIRG
jgi:hypothetical protein